MRAGSPLVLQGQAQEHGPQMGTGMTIVAACGTKEYKLRAAGWRGDDVKGG